MVRKAASKAPPLVLPKVKSKAKASAKAEPLATPKATPKAKKGGTTKPPKAGPPAPSSTPPPMKARRVASPPAADGLEFRPIAKKSDMLKMFTSKAEDLMEDLAKEEELEKLASELDDALADEPLVQDATEPEQDEGQEEGEEEEDPNAMDPELEPEEPESEDELIIPDGAKTPTPPATPAASGAKPAASPATPAALGAKPATSPATPAASQSSKNSDAGGLANVVDAANNEAQALAIRRQEAEKAGAANSSTHRTEWADFMRQCSNRNTFPVALAPRFRSNRLGLFQLFLKHGRSMQKVAVTLEKEVSNERAAESKYSWLKPRQMKEFYSDDKIKDIVERRTKAGVFKVDKEFPDDPEERRFPILVDDTYSMKGREVERLKAHSTQELDEEAGEALLGEDGILGTGSHLAVEGLSDNGTSSFLALIDSEDQTKKLKDKPKGGKDKDPTEIVPPTIKEQMASFNSKILKEMGDAKAYALALQPYEVATDLVRQMQEHGDSLERYYRRLSAAMQEPEDKINRGAWLKIKGAVETRFEWFKSRGSVAKSMIAKLLPKKAAKAKAKAKGKAT